MLNHTACTRCGASSGGLVCVFCGSLRRPVSDAAAERRALDELHAQLADKPREEQSRILGQAFLPDDPDVLVTAGERCLEMMHVGHLGAMVAADGLATRLEAIAAKLQIVGRRDGAQAFTRNLVQFRRERLPHRVFANFAGLGLILVKMRLRRLWNGRR